VWRYASMAYWWRTSAASCEWPQRRDRIPLQPRRPAFKAPGITRPPQIALFRAATAAHESGGGWRISCCRLPRTARDPRDVMKRFRRLPGSPACRRLKPARSSRPELESDACVTSSRIPDMRAVRPRLDWLAEHTCRTPSSTMTRTLSAELLKASVITRHGASRQWPTTPGDLGRRHTG